MSAFDLLDRRIIARLNEQAIHEPTLPQERAIPAILKGENVLIIAPTGTGKTEAASLPIFHRILSEKHPADGPARHAASAGITSSRRDTLSTKIYCNTKFEGNARDVRITEDQSAIEREHNRKGIKAIYITPLRALNRDMLRRFHDWGESLGITVAVRHGDTSQSDRRKQSLSPPDLLITTPETLQVMLMGKRLRLNLATVRAVVVDEVHEMASSKRGSQLAVLLERLVEIAGEFQRIGLSATVGSPDAVARLLVGTGRSCNIVQADVERISRFRVVNPLPAGSDYSLASTLECDPRLAAQIRWIRDKVGEKKCLIFVNTRQAAEVLGSRFRQLGEPIGVHHGSLSIEARVEAEEAFKSGALQGLICTSSMELGIDIGDVDHVIQYSSPREVSRLLQRVGRAGHRIGLVSSGSIIATCPDDVAEACAIARRAAASELEKIRIHELPTDVLANQIAGLEIDFGDISLEKVFQIVTRAYPFRELTLQELQGVVDQMEEHRLVRQHNGVLQRTRKAREYYIENLSMIPDEKRYNVYDIVGRRSVGTLDEAFVVGFAQPGATFVTKGEIWEITEIGEDEIKVVPIQRSGEIPSWNGEEIPVPFDVAQEVGRIRKGISDILEEGEDTKDSGGEGIDEGKDIGCRDDINRSSRSEEAVEWLQSIYPVESEGACELVDLIKRQKDKNLPVPDHSLVVVESGREGAVINCCFGHKTNDALGRTISSILSARFGSSVALQIDPYRIELTLPRAMLAEDIEKVILDLDPGFVEPILEMTLKNTTLLRWKMVHIARKFGALSRDVDYQRVSMAKLLAVFEGTPMYREALREIYHDRLDVEGAGNVLERIRNGSIAIKTSTLSPIGTSGRGGGRDVTSPEHADAAVIKLLKNRIMNDRVLLFCVNCKKWKSMRQVERVPDQPECPLCGSRMVAALKPWEEEEIKVVKKQEKKTAEEKRRAKRVFRNANLVLSYGKTAAIALASRGLGPETAARVVGKRRKDEIEFYRDILKAEKEYARTKRFWG